MITLEVLNPRGVPEKIEEEGFATRHESLEGKTIGLFTLHEANVEPSNFAV